MSAPQPTPSAGAVRAAKKIMPDHSSESDLAWAAEIIDLETGAGRFAEALGGLLDLSGAGDQHMPEAVEARSALAAWKEGQP